MKELIAFKGWSNEEIINLSRNSSRNGKRQSLHDDNVIVRPGSSRLFAVRRETAPQRKVDFSLGFCMRTRGSSLLVSDRRRLLAIIFRVKCALYYLQWTSADILKDTLLQTTRLDFLFFVSCLQLIWEILKFCNWKINMLEIRNNFSIQQNTKEMKFLVWYRVNF